MDERKRIVVDGIDTANCNFEASCVAESAAELFDPADYPAEARALVDECNRRLLAADRQRHMALLRAEMFAKGFEAGMYIARFDENENQVSFEFTDGTRRMLGYDGTEDLPDEFDSWIKTLVPEERDTIVRLYWDSVRMHRFLPEISHAEYRMRKKDGSIIWVTGAGRFVRRADGSLEVYMGCYREVTAEHEKAEDVRVIESIGKVFNFCLYIDVNDFSYRIIRSNEYVDAVEKKPDAFEFLRENVIYGVSEECRSEMDQWLRKDSILLQLSRGLSAEKIFHSALTDGWYRGVFMVGDRNEDGSPRHIIYGCEDVTQSKRIELGQEAKLKQRMVEIERLMRVSGDYIRVMSSTGFGMWHIYMKEGAAPRMQADDKMAELLGIAGREMTEEELYQWWFSRVSPEYVAAVSGGIEKARSGHFSETTYQWIHPEKGVIYARCGGTAEKLADGTVVLSGYHGDVTEIVREEQRRRKELEQLKESVHIDALTGANNRNAIDKFLPRCLENKWNHFYVAMMDVDRFKEINDTYGHREGDRALRMLAKAFMDALPEKTFFARYGGDEFLLVSLSTDPDKIRSVIRNARQALRERCAREETPYTLDFSCGIAQRTQEITTAAALLEAADAEMYRDKTERKAAR